MTTDLEQRVSRHLHDIAATVEDTSRLQHRVVSLSGTRYRDSRWLVVGVAGLCLVLIAGVLGVMAQSTDTTKAPAESPTATAEPSAVSVRQALAALPLGPEPMRPFTIERVVHDGSARVVIPGTDGGVVDRVRGGWLVLAEHDRTSSGGTFTSELAILDASGEVRPLPAVDQRLFTQDAAVSPDGTQVFAHSTVFDVETLQIVDQLATAAPMVYGWNGAGIIITSRGDGRRFSRWQPGEQPVPVDDEVIMVARDSTRAVVSRIGSACSSVVDLLDDGDAAPLLRGCGRDAPNEISPDGRRVYDGDVRISEVDARRTQALSPLAPFAGHVRGGGWEDSEHVLVMIALPASEVQVLRCSAEDQTCERAGLPVPVPDGEVLSFSASLGER